MAALSLFGTHISINFRSWVSWLQEDCGNSDYVGLAANKLTEILIPCFRKTRETDYPPRTVMFRFIQTAGLCRYKWGNSYLDIRPVYENYQRHVSSASYRRSANISLPANLFTGLIMSFENYQSWAKLRDWTARDWAGSGNFHKSPGGQTSKDWREAHLSVIRNSTEVMGYLGHRIGPKTRILSLFIAREGSYQPKMVRSSHCELVKSI